LQPRVQHRERADGFQPCPAIDPPNLANWIDPAAAGVPIEKFPIWLSAIATDLQSEKWSARSRSED
jgi:hypothetical protein